ncbi:response regulator [bacterium]|mgnify:CR=1 FL=1|nr:response regulator [bacterium]|tara:strand:+ start:15640 stop:16017 length:378 start_codon:yes stop_codon:yes gene_type:complete
MDNQGKKILLVEDDKFLSEILVKRLGESGEFEIKLSETVQGALDFFKQETVDLILLDLIMPGMDGFEFLKKAKDNPKISAIPIIVLSNLSQETEIEKAKDLGAKDYLIKANFTTKEIVEKIKAFI